MATTTWTNWARTVQVEVRDVAQPGTVADLQELLAASDGPIKPVGSGHSFTDVAATTGTQLRLDRLRGVLRADRETGRVTVLAGTTLHELNEALWVLGLALPNLGDIDTQTISGAISTGTHGTGRHFGGLATQVQALTLVTASGEAVSVNAERDAELFAAARIGLGALGVIADVTLQCEPAFGLAAAEAPAPLEKVLDELDELVEGNDHFEFYWFPHTRRTLTKRNNRVRPDAPLRPLSRRRRYVDDEFMANTAFGLLNELTTRRPGLIPRVNDLAGRLVGSRDYVDRSYRVFTSPRRVRFREMEYALPRAAVPEVLVEIESYLNHRPSRAEFVGFPIEVRFAAADDIWLSTAHGRDSGYIAVHQYARREHAAYFAAVEAIARTAGGRPHWGKLHGADAADLAPLYPRFDDFRTVRDRLDPHRRFANDYLRRVLGE